MLTTKEELLVGMAGQGACLPALYFVRTHQSDSSLEIVKSITKVEWFLWAAQDYKQELLDQFILTLEDIVSVDDYWALPSWDVAFEIYEAAWEEAECRDSERDLEADCLKWWHDRAEELLK